jgi:TRAP-type C4-dicarboxylate transport system permease small subunit
MMTVLVFVQVIFREVFNVGLQWVFELSRFFQVTMVWLGVPCLLYKKQHIRITALYDKFPETVRHMLDIFFYVIMFICVLMISVGYYHYFLALGKMVSPILSIPNMVFFSSIAIGIFFSLLVLIFKWRDQMGLSSNRKVEL